MKEIERGSRSAPEVRDTRPAGSFLTAPPAGVTIVDMNTRPDLTRRRHVDLARVSSASCRPAV
ncbi:putative leader peptide [Streptomyces sp. NPDC057197]|uniref:putative leader peptide n=1 Tax=unclassified Streptomyces TaxID=2593676 RepID=UPI003637CE87